MCLQIPEYRGISKPQVLGWQKRLHGLESVSLGLVCAWPWLWRLVWKRSGDPTDHASRDLTPTIGPLPWLGNSWPGAAYARHIPWGKDKCPDVPQVAGETPKLSISTSSLMVPSLP